LQNIPDYLFVYPEILVRQDIAQGTDFFPWDGGIFTPDVFRYFLDGFADYFKIPDNSVKSPEDGL
jgi:hypothetical protein